MSRLRAAAALAGALAAGPALAAGAGVLVVSQPAVAQYAEVLAGVREVRAADVVDVADAAAVADALARGPEVVIAVGSKALEVARARAGSAKVLAAAVLAPGDGIGGVPLDARAVDAARALRALAPKARTVTVLHPPGASAAVADARAAARAAGLEAAFDEIGDVAGFQAAFLHATEGRDAVWILADPRLARPEIVKFMVTAALERRVALIGFLDGMTRTGALLSVAADFRAIGREAGRLASEVASHPSEARAVRFAPGKLSVNERVREMLGLSGRAPEGAELFR
jgi:ABC-type uncharacterized transport system substrate-binding protein